MQQTEHLWWHFNLWLQNTQKQIGNKDRYIKYIEIDEEQADVVRYVSQFSTGNTKDNIAKELNKQGHKMNGKLFTGKSFERMLVNENIQANLCSRKIY